MTEVNSARGGLRWRAPLVAAGVILMIGGPMHPSAPSELSMRGQFATMMDDDAWIPAHSLLALGVGLIAWGLYEVYRRNAWPHVNRQALRIAVIAIGLYVIEALFHLFSYVDADRLRAEEFAPIAYIHIGLAAVMYPVSGIAISWLSVHLFRAWSVPAKVFAAAGIVGGLLHAFSVPVALIDPHAETDWLFAGAGILTSLWALSLGLVGIWADRQTAVGDRAAERIGVLR